MNEKRQKPAGKTEATGRVGNEQFRTLVENSLDVIMRFDRSCRHLYVNPLVEEQTGIPPDQFIGKTHAELGFPSDLVNLWEEALKKVFATAEPNRVEFQLPDGIWIDWLLVPEFSPDGSVETVITAARDITAQRKVEEALRSARNNLETRVAERTAELVREITDRKQAEEALRRSEETLRLIVEGSPGFFFYVHDAEGVFLYLSPSVKEITGRSQEEWKKHYTAYLTDNPINQQVVEHTERTLRGEVSENSYPVEIEHADGRRIFLQVYERPILKEGSVVGIQGVAHDITERRERERELRRLSSALAGLSEMVIITNLAHRVIYANQASNVLLGFRPEELIGRDSRELFNGVPGNPPCLGEMIARETVQDFWRGEIFCRKKDGTIISMDLSMTALKDAEGEKIGWVGISADITGRKRSEEELRFLSSITRQVRDAIVVTDRDFKIIYLNPAAAEMYGYSQEDIQGKSPGIFNAEPVAEDIQQDIYRSLGAGKIWEGAHLNRHKDGSTFTVELKISPLLDSRGSIIGYISIQRDISERRQLEEQLLHAQKMEAIGTLAGGLAHDFNNILAGITGYAYLAREKIESRETVVSELESIERLSQRGSDITEALLTFARGGEYRLRPININRIITDVLGIIGRTAVGINIRAELSPEITNVLGKEGPLHQLVLNLCLNSRDAMPEGGTLTVRTVKVEAGGAAPVSSLSGNGKDWIMVTVSDTGIGMDQETRKRIFDPFFTTKAETAGTGLGLAIVSGIVERLKGMIEVASAPGKGSVFTVFLPATRREESKLPPSPPEAAGGEETILVVDDDTDFRNIIRSALERFGYSVITAADGEDALKKLASIGGHIDLVLLDMIMTGMGGETVFRKIREMNPGLPVIISTGYSLKASSRHLLKTGAAAFLRKPFDYHRLIVTIREVLDRPKGGS